MAPGPRAPAFRNHQEPSFLLLQLGSAQRPHAAATGMRRPVGLQCRVAAEDSLNLNLNLTTRLPTHELPARVACCQLIRFQLKQRARFIDPGGQPLP